MSNLFNSVKVITCYLFDKELLTRLTSVILFFFCFFFVKICLSIFPFGIWDKLWYWPTLEVSLLLYNSQGLFTQLFISISFLRRLLDTVLKVTSRPIFVSRCITVKCLLFLWTCIRHENVMRALVIYAFFLKVLTVAL